MGCLDIPNETIFTMEITPIKFGLGATDEIAYDLKRLGVKHALIITDRGIMKLGLPERVRTLLEASQYGFAYDEIAAAMEAGWASSLPDLVDPIPAPPALSTASTCGPRRDSSNAVDAPTTPAPMITTSAVVTMAYSFALLG